MAPTPTQTQALALAQGVAVQCGNRGHHVTRVLRGCVIGIVLLSLGGCVAVYRNHGYVPTDSLLEEVVVGVDTRDSVIEALGRPSAEGVVNQSGVYYIGSRFRHWAWRAPQEVNREIVAISFDDQGIVRNVERLGLEDGRVVALSRRVTDKELGGTGFFNQLFNNFGTIAPGTGQPQ